MEERRRTLEGMIERTQVVRRPDNAAYHERQRGQDESFAGENDKALAEVYRKLARIMHPLDRQERGEKRNIMGPQL